MFNKSKKAIDTLNRQLNELSSITNVKQGNNWKASLKDTLNLYIGPQSSLSQRLDGLYFTRKETYVPDGVIGIFTDHVYDETKKENFKDLIQNAIKYIQSNGIYKNDSKRNFLGSFNNTEIISGIVVSIGLIYGIGNYFGKLEKDREIYQIEKQNETLENKINQLTEINAQGTANCQRKTDSLQNEIQIQRKAVTTKVK